jgi:hypothetical protein
MTSPPASASPIPFSLGDPQASTVLLISGNHERRGGCLALVPITKLPAALYVFPLSNTRIQARTTRSPQSRLRSPVAFRSLACVDEPNVYPQPSLFFLNFYLLSLPQQVIYRLTLHLLLKRSNANQTGSVLRSCRSPRIALC